MESAIQVATEGIPVNIENV